MMGAPHKVLTLEYTLRDKDGEIIDKSEAGEPMCLHLGKGLVVEGFEENVKDLAEGQTVRFSVSPEKGYGAHDPAMVQSLPRNLFPEDFTAEPGLLIDFETDMGAGTLRVVEADAETVTCDFNHPLAGQELDFEVSVLKVEEHSEEECDFEDECGDECGQECGDHCSCGCEH